MNYLKEFKCADLIPQYQFCDINNINPVLLPAKSSTLN